jgi:hypothetical protein
MNDEELKNLWRQQTLRAPNLSPAQLIPAMHEQTARLRRTLNARDLRELIACAVVIIVFGCFFFLLHAPAPISRLGDLIVIGSSIFIAFKLIHARRTTPSAPAGATIVESLRAELNAVRAQSRLLRTIAWWYLLPLGIGILLCTWGGFTGELGNFFFNSIYTLAALVLFFWIYRLNQHAVALQLAPLEAQLLSLLHSAETGAPMDELHASNLRPIALSIAAAEHTKPVEFKVAFWQLAIFGVPGVVGIWFFLMIAITDSNSQPQIPPNFVRTIEETNRYSVVARNLVDLFNAGDYPGIHRLYNKGMSEAFPLEETSDFYSRFAARAGRIKTFDTPSGGHGGWILFRLHCEHGEWAMNLALDADNRISGITIKPARSSQNIKSFLLRLATPLSLALFVPFLLAGFLYSWLMQKTTKRAVGISALGVHLAGGETIILWDDIKEVRPFRFLHIRNLRLIQASGEKTIMHWTPLERHADLKAAVEKFAPPNHPIRNHLPLLK